MRKQLEEKIEKNETILRQLMAKRENLERQISNLENKIKNQKFALTHSPEEEDDKGISIPETF